MTERELDEIALHALTLLQTEEPQVNPNNLEVYQTIKVGEYDIHYQRSSLTINQRGRVWCTIFRQTLNGLRVVRQEEAKHEHLPALLRRLRSETVLDRLARIPDDKRGAD